MNSKKLSYVLFISAIFFFLWLQSCKKDNNIAPGDIQNGDPIITSAGTPLGTGTSATIGASGGTLVSGDGRLSLVIPAGALSSDMDISIQPLSNEAPLGIGFGYRLLPEGTVFNQPAKLSFHFDTDFLDGSPADFLWIVTQASDGSWNALLKSAVDKNAGTVTVETSHFSDWALGRFIDFKLNPSSKTIKKGQSVQLQLSGFSKDKVTEDDELAPLIPITGEGDGLTPLTTIPPVESRLMDFKVKQWTMNGAAAPVSNNSGSLSASGSSANYTAPNIKPTINPVAVTVQLEANNKEGSKLSYLITANISVVESDYYLLVKIDGITYEYFQYGFDGTIPPDANNYSIANSSIDEGKLNVFGSTVINGGELVNGFAITFANVSETSRRLSGYYESGPDDVNFLLASPQVEYLLDYSKRTKLPDGTCEQEDLCSDVLVTILTYTGSWQDCTGYFSGTLYEDKDEFAGNCHMPIAHTIEGEFRLIPVE